MREQWDKPTSGGPVELLWDPTGPKTLLELRYNYAKNDVEKPNIYNIQKKKLWLQISNNPLTTGIALPSMNTRE